MSERNAYSNRFCPVCWRRVRRTPGDNVAGHMDSIDRGQCPMSGEPFTSALDGREFMKRYAA